MTIVISASSRASSGSRDGFTLLETVLAVALLLIALIPVGGVLVWVSHGREQATAKSLMLRASQSLMEEIIGTPPENIANAYDGVTRTIEEGQGGAASVTVDSTNPKLLVVTVRVSWTQAVSDESLTLVTYVNNPNG